MKKTFVSIMAALLSMTAAAQSTYDLNKPFGFCTVSSRTDASKTYDVTGGGMSDYSQYENFNGTKIILKSNGQDMKGTIQNAIKNNNVVILDGSDGDFIVSENIGITSSNKTVLGINNARICTKWQVTEEIINALNEADVPHKSTSGGGGTLPNGQYVKEEAEYYTRKIIIEKTGDNNENYRKSGCLSFVNCSNIIVRNITFQGPGSVDAGGNDLISSTGAKNIWVDHCAFMDGMDGNFDITNSANFHTVSWCIFKYTERSYMHQNTNLIGSNDNEATGYLNTTFAFNWWAPGCNQRMPMGRVGKIHMLNNYYSCGSAALCMNPRINSEFLIEGNYFASNVKNCYRANDNPIAVTWADNNVIANTSVSKPESFGTTVTVPYTYTVATANAVPDAVQNYAGATLPWGNGGGEETGTKGSIYWAMSSNTNASVAESIAEYITSTSVTNGSNLVLNDYGTYPSSGGIRFTRYQAQSIQTAPDATNTIEFSFTIKSGQQFKASSIEFYACKVGTGNGNMDVTWQDAGGKKVLYENVSPNRNNADNDYYSYYTKDVTSLSTATEGTCKLIINAYNFGATDKETGALQKKEIGLAQITIKGVVTNGATGILTPVTMSMPMDNTYYNIAGQRVANPTKGLYIVNGKKVIIK